jgi:hypothetical protein
MYNRLQDSDSLSSKKNKSFTYLEEHEIDQEFQETLRKKKTKVKNGKKYAQLYKNDPDQNLMEDVKISTYNLISASPEKQKTVKPEIFEEGPDLKYLNLVLEKFEENEQQQTQPNDIFKREETKHVTTMSLFKGSTPRTKDPHIISEYSLFYKNDYLRTLFSN